MTDVYICVTKLDGGGKKFGRSGRIAKFSSFWGNDISGMMADRIWSIYSPDISFNFNVFNSSAKFVAIYVLPWGKFL